MRWVRGNLQVFLKEGGRLTLGLAGKNALSCLDLLLSIPPAIFLSVCGVAAGLALTAVDLLSGGPLLPLLVTAVTSFAVPYLLLFLAGAITTATQWRRIRTSAWKKLLYTFTFPIFMATYVPITIFALFGRVEWKPIEHRAVASVQELR